jgi:hypothetical protein
VPGKPKQSRRAERCMYVERGVRCRRSGTGDPPLCHPHRIVMQDAVRPPPAFGDGVKNLVDRFVTGRRVTRKVWEDALGDLAAYAAQAAEAQAQAHSGTPHGDGGFRPPPGFTPPPNWWRSAPPPPPPPDPQIEERRRARIVLGFSPREPLTLEIIQRRRRELARRHHPDRGGSVAKMQAVNAAADVLEAELAPSS